MQNNLGFTKREKIFLTIAGVIAITCIFIPEETLKDWEIVYIILIGFPLGIMVVTDPERRVK